MNHDLICQNLQASFDRMVAAQKAWEASPQCAAANAAHAERLAKLEAQSQARMAYRRGR